MFKKFKLQITLVILLGIFVSHVYAQDKFEPSIDIDISIVSTYVFRGVDVFQNKYIQDKKTINSFNVAPALQPSITFNFTEGWSFNIWTSYALTNRLDKDIDEILQQGPYDNSKSVARAYTDYIAGIIFGNGATFNTVKAAIATEITSNPEGYIKGEESPPAFYKEPVGLRRLDEVDLTLSYSFDTKLGTMYGGIVTYLLPNVTKDVVGTDQFTELFVGYSPKILPAFSITLYGEFNGDEAEGSTFTYISYSIPIFEKDSVSLSFDPGFGYQTQNNLQGIKYVNLPISLSLGDFTFSVVGIYRPNVRFYDSDPYLNDAVQLLGLSTNKDGLIPDPAKTTGIINFIINSYIQQNIQSTLTAADYPFTYSYTPTQSIPKFIYYISASYSVIF